MPINALEEALESSIPKVDSILLDQSAAAIPHRNLVKPAAHIDRYPHLVRHHVLHNAKKSRGSPGVLSILEATAKRLASSTADGPDDAGDEGGISESSIQQRGRTP